MPFLTEADWERMRADMLNVRADNEVSIVIRRGDAELPAQLVRIAGKGYAASKRRSEGTIEGQTTVEVLGGVDFDVRLDDRFTHDGDLYRVVFVEPNRRVKVSAQATLEE